MSFATTMTALKDKVDGLIANRVAKFAYTQRAYNSNLVNGVDTYNFNNDQNIPSGTASVLKVNETVLTKGYRTQASAITRMLMNHFLGRTSYNLNKTVDFLKDFMLAVEDNMGVASGFATLDANAHLPLAQLTPNVVIDCGEWDADTNTPELEIGEGRKGDTYRVSVAGTQNLGEGAIIYRVGDTIMYNGSIWVKNGSGTVSSVNTVTPDETGNVTITGEDISTSSSDLTSIKDRMIEYAKLSFTNLLGRVWELITMPNSALNLKGKVHYDNVTQCYYACFNTSSANTTNGVYKSLDGKTWSATNITCGNIGGFSGFVYFIKQCSISLGMHRYIIGTSQGVLYTDDYFHTYTWSNLRTGDFTVPPSDVNTYGQIFLRNLNTLYKSEDFGMSWSIDISAMSSGTIAHEFIQNGDTIATLVYSGGSQLKANVASTQPNLTRWIIHTIPQSTATNTVGKLKYFPEKNMWIAFGGTFIGLCCSTDAFDNKNTYTSSPINVVINDIVFNGKVWIAVTASGIKYSSNLANWNNSNVTSGNYTQLAYGNGIALACLGSGTSVKIKYSMDGATWTDCNIPSNSPYVINGYFNGVWLVYADVVNKAVNYYSTDGINFTLTNTTYYDTLYSAKVQEIQLVHGMLFGKADDTLGGTYISSVDTLIERGWVNID